MRTPYPLPAGIVPERQDELADLVRRPGPFVSCYLQVDPAAEPAPETSLLHWKPLRRALEEAGAPAGALDAIEAKVPEAHRYGVSLGIVADEDGVLLEDHSDEPLVADLARFSPLPALGPLLEWRERQVAYVVGLVDRAGADIVAFGAGAGGEVVEASVGEDDAHDPMLHKVRSGGWSQPRYQRRVAAKWEADAKEVADLLAELAEAVGARIVLVGGDVRALELLEGVASASLAEKLTVVAGSRAAGSDVEEEQAVIDRALATVVARDHAAALASLGELVGKELACVGPEATLDALSQGQVAVLLVNDDPGDDREAAFSLDPFVAATAPEPLRGLGRQPAVARLVDVAIAGALSSGAGVRVVPAAERLRGGLGGLLRFAAAP